MDTVDAGKKTVYIVFQSQKIRLHEWEYVNSGVLQGSALKLTTNIFYYVVGVNGTTTLLCNH